MGQILAQAAGALPAMTGGTPPAGQGSLGAYPNVQALNAAALALGNAAGGGAMGVPPGGGPPAAGAGQNMQNPLARMLAGLGPAYQPGDTRWGMPGDRLLRFTPQQGNQGMFGKGGQPPAGGGPGQSGIVQNPNGSTSIPGLNPLGIGDGSGLTINWQNLVSATNPPPSPPGNPAFTDAMNRPLPPSVIQTPNGPAGTGTGTPLPDSAVNAAQQALRDIRAARPEGARTNSPEYQAWFQRFTDATNAYNAALSAAGRGPGGGTFLAEPWITR